MKPGFSTGISYFLYQADKFQHGLVGIVSLSHHSLLAVLHPFPPPSLTSTSERKEPKGKTLESQRVCPQNKAVPVKCTLGLEVRDSPHAFTLNSCFTQFFPSQNSFFPLNIERKKGFLPFIPTASTQTLGKLSAPSNLE